MSDMITRLPAFLALDGKVGSVRDKVLRFAGLPKFVPRLTKTPRDGGTTTPT